MAANQTSKVIQRLMNAVLSHNGAGLTDGQLLGRFVEQRDDTAFAALVKRHGPMVWGVCSRALGNHHDAEDAFQAAFLVLFRKAGSVRPREMVVNWLHGVARRAALQVRRIEGKRREKQVTELPERAAVQKHDVQELQALLDEELGNLPGKYRVLILLCDIEGKTEKEAARQLNVPEGTVAGRLARARSLLAKRLTRRGLVLPGGALAALLSQNAISAGVPKSVIFSTIKTASLLTTGQTAGVISTKVAVLTEGVLKTMLMTKLKIATVVLLMLGFVTAGGGLLSYSGRGAEQFGTSEDMQANEQRKPNDQENSDTAEVEIQVAKTAVTIAERQVLSAKAKIAEAGAVVQAAKAKLARWDSEALRIRKLFQDKIIDKQVLDETETQLAIAKAEVDQAVARVTVAENALAIEEARLQFARANLSVAEARLQQLRAGRSQAKIEAVVDLLKTQLKSAQQAQRAAVTGLKEARREKPADAYTWSVRWLHAQRDLSQSKDERAAAFADHYQRMKELHEIVTNLTKFGQLSPAFEMPATTWYLAEAELWLLQERGR